ncbi:hypothetical protein AWH56_005955 [Anaerobacillus isosaccharinicus]|uniref:Uncharacterized protein n=1 Tax=Anaerobacillus isosaccharinicus TaxID=1532552 RepID=A0A1S2LVF9_9BACI|nr:hypothetical protein [Anaerobacillus isosaccharinicus]MBA5584431.1 hypothetical protein [Anaerobacillus isosaccharinicus]QOY37180.1 hypothetical protein AWH56_005955 [Anaerobacillus isosaccharinicus]
MGLFDRFTGKEIEESIEAYSTKYGDILIGIHKKLQSHEKQLVNMVEKLDRLKENQEANKRMMESLQDADNEIKKYGEKISILKEELEELKTVQKATATFIAETTESLKKKMDNDRTLVYEDNKLLHNKITEIFELHKLDVVRFEKEIKKQQKLTWATITGFSFVLITALIMRFV